MDTLGLYIHYPFCIRKCPYCGFYSICYRKEKSDLYCNKIVKAIETYPFNHIKVDTIYFGGGTPVLAGAENIKKILDCANKNFDTSGSEVTMEANPAYTFAETLNDFKRAGVNRLSFGVQSLDNKCLKTLGRSHSAEEAVSTIEKATHVFGNISVDIMLGIPHQTINDVQNFVETFDNMGIKHISAYMLKIEKGTPFYTSGIEKICPDEDTVCDIYLDAVNILEHHGYHQYEISNFAKDGFESKHNNKYWMCKDYIGIGPSAHSCIEGTRYTFKNDIEKFIYANDIYSHLIKTEKGCDLEEFVMLGLRLSKGINVDEIKKIFDEAESELFLERAKFLSSKGLTNINNRNISLTPKGFLVSNAVIIYILYGI